MVYGEGPVRTVLAAEDRLVASDWPQATSALVGPDSLNLLSGPRHGAVKRALAEAFGEAGVRRRVPRIAALVQEYVGRWASGSQPLSGIAACQELSQAVFDCVVLGGDGSPSRAAALQSQMAALAGGFQTPPLELPFTAYGKAVAARAAFGRLAAESIQRSRAAAAVDCCMSDAVALAAAAAAGGGGGSDAVSLPDSLLVDNAAASMFGNASTGPSLAKALQYLCARPDVLERLREEQRDLVAKYGADVISGDVLDGMTYGSAVAREILRITPAVPAVFRVAITDFEMAGRRIPKGWRVWCHLGESVLKYNKDAFAPERWLPASTTSASSASSSPPPLPSSPSSSPAAATAGGGCPMHAASAAAAAAVPEYSLPFGTGVRTCLGRHIVTAELLVFLAVLARGYDWTAANPAEEWRVVPAPAPKEGLMVTLRRRG
ncbi:hypothetical protein HYH03_008457 [Edaphochlamys debaryana]|uniref:Cytochrome P450 n=1 Tax=Edaphochlamys debaryana TaxID=47281 RepID=A0A835XYB2_9CHLO|nr:hypothetical protein HYH03_008457 [Edaphochlamys debaryana]|eukprot:KAG2493322.1 hypothetical protein HYH03_008457 [Edaphochlamys debaryana]